MNLLKRTTALLGVALLLGTTGCGNSSGDAAITGRVKTAISKEPGGTAVSVSTDKKVVHLSGTVKSREERAMLIAAARRVEGVKAVKTDLVVAAQQKPVVQAQTKTKPVVQAQAKTKPVVQGQAKTKPRAQQRVAAQKPAAPPPPPLYGH